MPLQFSYGRLPFNEVLCFLKETDGEFQIPLSTIIDLHAYAKKLSEFSDFSICRDGGSIIGMISCYTNHPPEGFISNVCIKSMFQRQGVFRDLFQLLNEKVKTKGIRVLRLEVDKNNEKAYNIYMHLGFNFVEYRNESDKFLLEYLI